MQTSIPTIVNFLTELYESGLGYSALNTARSALASFVNVPGITCDTLGQNLMLKRFFRGVFHLKPSFPRYRQIWNVDPVLDYLKTLDPVKKLSLKFLTMKLVMLLDLVSGQRLQTLYLLKTTNIRKEGDDIVFILDELVKQSAAGKQQPCVRVKPFDNEPKLCVLSTLKEYLNRTVEYRTSANSNDRLFISFVKPYRNVSKDTLARWIKTVMKEAGVDVNMFKPHSVRAASTSKAALTDLPIDTILETAGWSRENTFAKFYNKNIIESNKLSYSVAVLSKK